MLGAIRHNAAQIGSQHEPEAELPAHTDAGLELRRVANRMQKSQPPPRTARFARAISLSRTETSLPKPRLAAPVMDAATQDRHMAVQGALTLVRQLWPAASGQADIGGFLDAALRHSKAPPDMLRLAMLYVVRLQPQISQTHTNQTLMQHGQSVTARDQHGPDALLRCPRRTILAALDVAGKMLNDRTMNSKGWSKISGLPAAEISGYERSFLQSIDHRTHVDADAFAAWKSLIDGAVPRFRQPS